MNLIEASKKADDVIKALMVSVKKEQVENVFAKNGIGSSEERIQLLRECMGVIGTSDMGTPLPHNEEYDDEMAIFLDGKWRLLL